MELKKRIVLISSIIIAVILISFLSKYPPLVGFFTSQSKECIENWQCGNWTSCSRDGIQIRACNDANNCGTSISKPAEIKECIYIPPSCSDNIQNQGELGVDCGGPCLPCEKAEIGEESVKILESKTPTPLHAVITIALLVALFILLNLNRLKLTPKQKFAVKITHMILIITIIILVSWAVFKKELVTIGKVIKDIFP